MRWTGATRSRRFLLGAVMSIVAGVALIPAGLVWMGLLMVGVGAVLALFTSVTVTIDDGGLTAVSWFPIMRAHFPLDRIEGAEVIDVQPWRMGGWGYRGSVTAFKRAAWILRGGPGIRLDLAGGRRFIISIDDPESGVAVLRGLLTRAG